MREAAVVSQANPLQRIPGVALVLLFLITMFSAIAPGFLSIANLSNVVDTAVGAAVTVNQSSSTIDVKALTELAKQLRDHLKRASHR